LRVGELARRELHDARGERREASGEWSGKRRDATGERVARRCGLSWYVQCVYGGGGGGGGGGDGGGGAAAKEDDGVNDMPSVPQTGGEKQAPSDYNDLLARFNQLKE